MSSQIVLTLGQLSIILCVIPEFSNRIYLLMQSTSLRGVCRSWQQLLGVLAGCDVHLYMD
jgi:hypothetical protein